MQFFGGRGSSGNGKGGAGGGAQSVPNTAAANQPYANRLQAVQNMTNDEFEDYLNNNLSGVKLDSSYNYSKDCNFQKMVSDCGLNDKPTVVDSKTFDQMLKSDPNAKVIYRGVTDTKYMGSSEILNQIKNSDGFHVGGGGYGDGLYYTGSHTEAMKYAGAGSWAHQGLTQRAIISPDAKVISRADLMKEYNSLPDTTKAALRKAGNQSTGSWYNSGESQLAIKLGYDAIQGAGSNHLVILNRKALIIDDKNYDYTKLKNTKKKTAASHTYKDITQITT